MPRLALTRSALGFCFSAQTEPIPFRMTLVAVDLDRDALGVGFALRTNARSIFCLSSVASRAGLTTIRLLTPVTPVKAAHRPLGVLALVVPLRPRLERDQPCSPSHQLVDFSDASTPMLAPQAAAMSASDASRWLESLIRSRWRPPSSPRTRWAASSAAQRLTYEST